MLPQGNYFSIYFVRTIICLLQIFKTKFAHWFSITFFFLMCGFHFLSCCFLVVLLYSFLYLESVHKVKVSSGQKQHLSSCLDFRTDCVAIWWPFRESCSLAALMCVHGSVSIIIVVLSLLSLESFFKKMQISTLFQGIS